MAKQKPNPQKTETTPNNAQAEQSRRFIDTAHELKCDEDENRFNSALKKEPRHSQRCRGI